MHESEEEFSQAAATLTIDFIMFVTVPVVFQRCSRRGVAPWCSVAKLSSSCNTEGGHFSCVFVYRRDPVINFNLLVKFLMMHAAHKLKVQTAEDDVHRFWREYLPADKDAERWQVHMTGGKSGKQNTCAVPSLPVVRPTAFLLLCPLSRAVCAQGRLEEIFYLCHVCICKGLPKNDFRVSF